MVIKLQNIKVQMVDNLRDEYKGNLGFYTMIYLMSLMSCMLAQSINMSSTRT